MSNITNLEQFSSNITPLKSTDQAQMKLWVQLGFSAIMPPSPNAWKGTTPGDCDLAIERIKLGAAAFLDFVATIVEQTHENLPMTQVRHLKQLVVEVQNDAVALLEIAADEQAGL